MFGDRGEGGAGGVRARQVTSEMGACHRSDACCSAVACVPRHSLRHERHSPPSARRKPKPGGKLLPAAAVRSSRGCWPAWASPVAMLLALAHDDRQASNVAAEVNLIASTLPECQ